MHGSLYCISIDIRTVSNFARRYFTLHMLDVVFGLFHCASSLDARGRLFTVLPASSALDDPAGYGLDDLHSSSRGSSAKASQVDALRELRVVHELREQVGRGARCNPDTRDLACPEFGALYPYIVAHACGLYFQFSMGQAFEMINLHMAEGNTTSSDASEG